MLAVLRATLQQTRPCDELFWFCTIEFVPSEFPSFNLPLQLNLLFVENSKVKEIIVKYFSKA